jgi:Pyruvate/2-oxoacid:ferredoxin oxidoreductase gamma subunit
LLPRLNELGIQVHTVNADALAQQLGATAVANLVVLGFAAAREALGVTVAELQAAVQALGPAKAVAMNLKALEAGASMADPTPSPSPVRNNAEQERGVSR